MQNIELYKKYKKRSSSVKYTIYRIMDTNFET